MSSNNIKPEDLRILNVRGNARNNARTSANKVCNSIYLEPEEKNVKLPGYNGNREMYAKTSWEKSLTKKVKRHNSEIIKTEKGASIKKGVLIHTLKEAANCKFNVKIMPS